ncbi:hypothetical protein JR065_00710 [Xanthomonas sp. AmX2]|uniref:hypothetical protein n=1 Tax=Xanthomonas sp. TaxID=29446 RepID=UPI0019803BDF|nr:hypothetical protein [Xanthomonas sp.]MBN6148847.1 hypothetical protein [Xanthomonas sp.]
MRYCTWMRPPPNPNAAPAVRDGHRRRSLRIAPDLIQARFGADNFDDAHDALIDLLRECCGNGGYRVDADFDARHPNPWFHRYVLHLDDGPADLGPEQAGAAAGVSEVCFREFVRRVAALGLDPAVD